MKLYSRARQGVHPVKLYSRARQGVLMWCAVLPGVEYGDKTSIYIQIRQQNEFLPLPGLLSEDVYG